MFNCSHAALKYCFFSAVSVLFILYYSSLPSVSVYALWRINYPQWCKSDLHKQALESQLTRIHQGISCGCMEQSLFLTLSRCSVTSVLRNLEVK